MSNNQRQPPPIPTHSNNPKNQNNNNNKYGQHLKMISALDKCIMMIENAKEGCDRNGVEIVISCYCAGVNDPDLWFKINDQFRPIVEPSTSAILKERISKVFGKRLRGYFYSKYNVLFTGSITEIVVDYLQPGCKVFLRSDIARNAAIKYNLNDSPSWTVDEDDEHYEDMPLVYKDQADFIKRFKFKNRTRGTRRWHSGNK